MNRVKKSNQRKSEAELKTIIKSIVFTVSAAALKLAIKFTKFILKIIGAFVMAIILLWLRLIVQMAKGALIGMGCVIIFPFALLGAIFEIEIKPHTVFKHF